MKSRRHRVPAASTAALLLLLSVDAAAVERGDSCTLKAPLQAKVTRPSGTMESVLDAGTDVQVLYVGDEGRSSISTGNMRAAVATRDLEAACSGTLQFCRANAAFSLFERNRSDSRSWTIEKGSDVSVLRSGKVWAHLRAGEREGFAPVVDVKAHCAFDAGGAMNEGSDASLPTEDVERGDGPGILALPFLLEGAAPAGIADSLADALYERLASYRPDVGRLPLATPRTVAWKPHVDASALRARAAGLAYVVVGKVAADDAAKDAWVVSVAVIDSATGKTVKGVRAKPTGKPDDRWVEQACATLLPLLAAAPGSRLPNSSGPIVETAPVMVSEPTTTKPQPATSATSATAGEWRGRGWYEDGWAWLGVGAAAAIGAGAGVAGALAWSDNAAANGTAPVDDARNALRSSALQKAVVADVLTGTAIVVGLGAIVAFATGE